MKRNRKWIILGSLIILATLLLFVNFHLSVSKNNVSRNSVTSSTGEIRPETVQRRDPIILIVNGKNGMATAIQKAVSAQLSAEGIGSPIVSDTVEPANKSPILLIEIIERKVFWTPFYGTSSVHVLAGYVSNGDISQIQNLPVKSSNLDGVEILMSGDYKLTDKSFGIISLPAYRRSLAEAIVQSAMEDIRSIYQIVP